MILRCGRCRQDLGTFDPKDLSVPLKAEMFKSLRKNYPEPFRAGQEWPYLMCRICGMCVTIDPRRPGEHPDFVVTPGGKFEFGKKDRISEAAIERQREIDRAWNNYYRDGFNLDCFEKPEDYDGGKPIILPINYSNGEPPETPFACKKCGKKFKSETWLKKHTKKCKGK